MDLDDLDIFSRYSVGTFALISGMAIIGSITYFIYVIFGHVNTSLFFYSVIPFGLGILIPPFFFLEDLTETSDIFGKFLSGTVVAVMVWIAFPAGTQAGSGLTSLEFVNFIVLPGIFTFITSLLVFRGVAVPLIEEKEFGDSGGWTGIELEDEDEEEFEDEDFEEKTPKKKKRRGTKPYSDDDLFPEERDDSW